MKLILLVCMIATPDVCHEEQLSFSFAAVNRMACMIGAQPLIAEWAGTHPQWRVARWRCNTAAAEGYRT